MKRFITYLYECERGNKSKNVGFIRVNVHREEVRMEIFIRNLLIGKTEGKLYALMHKNELIGIKLAELSIANGQGDSQISFRGNDILESGFSLQDIVGIAIRLDCGVYIASCWEDAFADAITRGEFEARGNEMQEETKFQLVAAEEEQNFLKEQNGQDEEMESLRTASIATYEKLDLSQIRDLPSPNWHLSTNSFLLHGFWNYGYLVLKKEMEEDKEKLSLGVPGIFERPEAVMAVFFGFPTFEEVPVKEKNQEAKVGTFGCWFVTLKM